MNNPEQGGWPFEFREGKGGDEEFGSPSSLSLSSARAMHCCSLMCKLISFPLTLSWKFHSACHCLHPAMQIFLPFSTCCAAGRLDRLCDFSLLWRTVRVPIDQRFFVSCKVIDRYFDLLGNRMNLKSAVRDFTFLT